MHVVHGEVVGDAREARVDVGAAEVLGRDHLARRGLHQGRAGEEDGALLPHDDRLVAHRGHVGAAGGAAPHHGRDLRDAERRHGGLVEEDAAEVVAVREDLVLVREVGAAAVHQVDAGEAVLLGDLLGAEVLLHGDREVGAALHRGVVGDDDALAPRNAADAGDDAAGGHLAVVQPVPRQRRQFEKGGAGVQQALHPCAGQQLAPREVALARRLGPATRRLGRAIGELVQQAAHPGGVGAELGGARVDGGGEDSHAVSLNSSRPISMRRISLVPAPIS